jgi:hypothetical protein
LKKNPQLLFFFEAKIGRERERDGQKRRRDRNVKKIQAEFDIKELLLFAVKIIR